MKILYASSEVAGFAKTGGLADVAGSLPVALAARGLDCAVVMPLYRACRSSGQKLHATEHRLQIPIGERFVEGRIWRSSLPDSDVPVYLIEQPDYFDRDELASGRGLYQYADPKGKKLDYADNCARFVFFSRAIIETMRLLDFWPDVLHLNDWQTGLAAIYLREWYLPQAARDQRARYERIRTMFTIHNLAFAGLFWHLDMPLLGLPVRLFNLDQLEFHGHISFLKGGVVAADMITTVSPTYAKEIQTVYLGCGLHGMLMQRNRRLFGIVNGIDERVWNPATDLHIAAHYDAATLAVGKPKCKATLQRHYQLDVQPGTPLLGIVSRLARQKGLSLLEPVVSPLLQEGVQLVVLGDGDLVYKEMLLKLRERYPSQVGLTFELNEAIAHQIEAGADIFLMPSEYEPCGLNQLYSLKYGTVPVVRRTGGLADTVVDASPANLAAGSATGFAFVPFAAAPFAEALGRAVAMYRDDPLRWRQVQETGMRQDWSWARSAAEYDRLYHAMTREG